MAHVTWFLYFDEKNFMAKTANTDRNTNGSRIATILITGGCGHSSWVLSSIFLTPVNKERSLQQTNILDKRECVQQWSYLQVNKYVSDIWSASFIHSLLTQCSHAFCDVIPANTVVATADNSSVVREDGDVELPEGLQRRSAAVFIADGPQRVIVDGAVHCDAAGFCRKVAGTLWHHRHHWSGNHFCNTRTSRHSRDMRVCCDGYQQ